MPAAADDRRARRWLSSLLAVVASISLAVALMARWTERTVFDADGFADRTVVLLESSAVRHGLAEAITDELIASGNSELSSYRFLLVTAIEDVVGIPAFRNVFRSAVRLAHEAVFQRDADRAVLELADTVSILASSTESSGQSFVDKLPREATSLLVDVTPQLRHLDLWRIGQDLRWLDDVAWIVTLVAAVGSIVIDRRRRAVVKLAFAVAGAGLLIVIVTSAAAGIAADDVRDPVVADAVRSVVNTFVADLRTLGWWLLPIGAVVAAAASSASDAHPWRRSTAIVGRVRELWATAPTAARVAGGAAMVGVGALLVVQRDAVAPAVAAAAGLSIAYVGLVELLALLGPPPLPSIGGALDEAVTARRTLRHGAVALVAVAVVAAVTFGLVTRVEAARDDARRASVLRCNGFAELCDRRLDQVAFAGAHNAMSAASDPTWLFAENLTGIPSQLVYGVRAFLVKTHYGLPTGVSVDGAELIVTDTDAEIANNAPAETDELSPEAVARAQELERTARPPQSQRQIYLCHVYCSLGATKFSDTLGQIRRFLDRHPHEVIILFIGDYVSPADTAKAIEEARLGSRVWTYDRSAPPPTLREMITARRNLLVLSENAGGTPPWYTPGYGIFQDTPYTFADPSQFSCARNRGPTDAPLFQINHWITNTKPPSASEAVSVNAYDALLGWVRRCQQERGMFPTIIGVNFFSQGDLRRVVDTVNGVG